MNAKAQPDGTNDLLVSDVIRTNEKQVWFIAELLVDPSAMSADPAPDGDRSPLA